MLSGFNKNKNLFFNVVYWNMEKNTSLKPEI